MTRLLLFAVAACCGLLSTSAYGQSGCTNPTACNYDFFAVTDDGSCIWTSDCAGNCGGTYILDECGNCYDPSAGDQIIQFYYSGSIVNWTVPDGVTEISIEAWGAQGGNSGGYTGGLGAHMGGTFSVNPGDVLKVLVGQQGYTANCAAGGGGGSFISTLANAPLLVAGGGSGATCSSYGKPGLVTEAGGHGDSCGSNGGVNGNGGEDAQSCGNGTGGGGGFYSNGSGDGSWGWQYGYGFVNGGGGGTSATGNAYGGFGGGAGTHSSNTGGGPGGGYSGGGAPNHGQGYSGGGGGSFNAGVSFVAEQGVRSGNGLVLISYSTIPYCELGCTDPIADNYSPTATNDDGSCSYDFGCIDPAACNFDPIAIYDDGTCAYYFDCNGTCGGTWFVNPCGDCVDPLNDPCLGGCMNPDAYNYNAEADYDDGSCTVLICDNYDGPAVVEFTKSNYADYNSTYDEIIPGYRISRGNRRTLFRVGFDGAEDCCSGYPSNTQWKTGDYNSPYPFTSFRSASTQNGQALRTNLQNSIFEMTLYIPGEGLYFNINWNSWTSNNSGGGFSYTRTILAEESGCIEVPFVAGCMDAEAYNYDSNATFDDGSCVYDGCTDVNAYNYNPIATIEDGSCTILTGCDFDGDPLVTFTRSNYAANSNFDLIVAGIQITRNNNGGLWNYGVDGGWNGSGPTNTQWKIGDYNSGYSFNTWRNAIHYVNGTALRYNLGSAGFITTLYLPIQGYYFEVEWHSWTGGNAGGGFSYTRRFLAAESGCQEVPLIYGCMDAEACNYDALATYEDGSCFYGGCTDPSACNFDPNAPCDNGTCAYVYDCNGVCGGTWITDACGNCFDPESAAITQFNYTGSIQQWTVPAGVTEITIEAFGAQGGGGGISLAGGLGARMRGSFSVSPGQVFDILVGQQGQTGYQTYDPHGNENGGGGGSFVVLNAGNVPYLIAGGGGGGPALSYGTSCGRDASYAHGQITESGSNISCYNYASGGTNGNGGSTSGSYMGGAGGGFYSGGANGGTHCWTATGGSAYVNGGAGGQGNGCYGYNNRGGYGGGGGGQLGGPGGGGGYSGGATAANWSSYSTYGGGGGSYNVGVNQDNESGVQSGNGLVIISYPLIPDCAPGCTDPLADNYDPAANFEDGSCIYYLGCIDVNACNFDPTATEDDGSCLYIDCNGVCGGNWVLDACGNCYDPNESGEVQFAYTGGVQTFVVPADGEYTFEAWGAQGGDILDYYPITGGLGGYAKGTMNLTAGQTLYVYVGGSGQDRNGNHPYGSCAFAAGGYNGGGATRTAGNGSPGGGASDVRVDGTDLADRVIVAGGGGGCGWTYSKGGAGGGLTGQNGTRENQVNTGAIGGGQAAGGARGTTCDGCGTVTDGTFGQGGNAAGCSAGGGGGGGGWYGGGGGGYADGGGGGSSYIDGLTNGETLQGVQSGDGFVIITYTTIPVCNPGCTDALADNYDPNANFDDGSCLYDLGCMDPAACNYDPLAGNDDGSCAYFFDCNGTCGGDWFVNPCGDCVDPNNDPCLGGCTNPGAYNYDPNADYDDGSCTVLDCDYQGDFVVTFTKGNYADYNTVYDEIVPGIRLSRGNRRTLFRVGVDSPESCCSFPTNTQWKIGDYNSGYSYQVFRSAFYGPNGNTLRTNLQTGGFITTLYLPNEGFYFEVEWHSWTSNGNGGGYSYTRTFLPEESGCVEVPLLAGCTDPLAINYDANANFDDGSCDYLGCTDQAACNYDPQATIDDGTCNVPDGNGYLECPEDIAIEAALGENCAEVNYDLPVVQGICANYEMEADLLTISNAFAANYGNVLGAIANEYNFSYDGGANSIGDGGGDMYDGGNYLNTNLGSNLNYTSGAVTANAAFGANGAYFTHQQPGLFLMTADLDGISYFETTGNLGADGQGSYSGFEVVNGNYRGFFKRVCSAGDPSVNHLMIVEDTGGITQYYPGDTNNDQHRIDGLTGSTRIYYLLWAGNSGYCYQQAEVEALMDAFLQLLPQGNPELTAGLNSGSCFPGGTTTVTWVYTDEFGTEYPCSFDVTVNVNGCTDPNAYNYNQYANVDDGSCTILTGCDFEGEPVVTFTRNNYDPNTNYDLIVPGIQITRNNNGGLWNYGIDGGWNGSGPTNTQWKIGDLNSPYSLTTWRSAFYYPAAPYNTALRYNLGTSGFITTLYLPVQGYYFEVVWHSWTGGNAGGGFSYTRRFLAEESGCEEVPLVYGCMNSQACNYDPIATFDDASCIFGGCMDMAACNYDPNAVCDNGTCAYFIDCAGTCGGTYILDACGNCFDPEAAEVIQFNYTGSIQQWTVPAGITEITIEAYGAQGGGGGISLAGGLGARMRGTFSVTPGEVFDILVGQQGQTGYDSYDPHGNENGGGGGSFVVLNAGNVPYLIAGGGGGGPSLNYGMSCGRDASYAHGQISESGASISCYNYASGGTNGNGGSTSGSYMGGAGGGFYSNGSNGGTHCWTAIGGASYLSGGAGGQGNGCYGYNNRGGYGGGGGGQLGGPGGGGGYSGGATAASWSSYSTYGGGGGSYNAGVNQDNESGAQSGNGLVIISYPLIPDCAPGCTDPLADNYDPAANFDDGSCIYYLGCIDVNACNFDPTATEDDGSCQYLDCNGVCGGNWVLDACGNCYDPNANVQDAVFNYTGGLQYYTVPNGVTQIQVEATGAQGGNSSYGVGGRGARIIGTLSVTPGEQLTVLVGGQGSGDNEGAGGGGGTFIVNSSNQPLIVAGGGGGAGGYQETIPGDYQDGKPGVGGTSGTVSQPSFNQWFIADGQGGINGNGGTGGQSHRPGGGGGGFYTDGSEYMGGYGGGSYGRGGDAYLNGAAGGLDEDNSPNQRGGYGGGGGSALGGGGGGGYSGGGGGTWSGYTQADWGHGGGGGGSFNAGADPVNEDGYQLGNGYVNINLILIPECTPGCTDPVADNYNPAANFDDGSCLYDLGCMDPAACNYDPLAGNDDGSCAYYFDCNGTCGGDWFVNPCGDCVDPNNDPCLGGCTNPGAYNYDPNADYDDGSCTVLDCDYEGDFVVTFTKGNYADYNSVYDEIVPGIRLSRGNRRTLFRVGADSPESCCSFPTNTQWKIGDYNSGYAYQLFRSAFYGPNGNVLRTNLQTGGFITTLYLPNEGFYFEVEWHSWTSNGNGGGYSYTRTFLPEESGCVEVPLVAGCTNPNAVNYDANANFDDGTCIVEGCTDPIAYNYNAEATVDDGSCTILAGCDYDGEIQVTFTKNAYADPNSVFDDVSPTVSLTRGSNYPVRGIYNRLNEGSFIQFSSPTGTEWHWGDVNNPNAFTTWRSAVYQSGYGPQGALLYQYPGNVMTMRTLAEGFVFEFEFHSWTSGNNGGGVSYTRTFMPEESGCTEVPLIYGCMDPITCNYSPDATYDDGSCIYGGCIDAAACNFDPNATCDDGTCIYFIDCAGTCGGTFVQDDCGNCYDPAAGEIVQFNYTGSIQQWTVPAGVTEITVEAFGAQGGGGGSSYTGGLGARMKGTFSVNPGDVFDILVGQQGQTGSQTYDPHGNQNGGGGGSFVVLDAGDIPFVVAGGGGGGPAFSYGTACGRDISYAHGQITEAGSNISCAYYASGGTNGNGGSASGSYMGGAGGGFYSNGSNGGTHCCTSIGGASYLNGAAGGSGDCCYGTNNRGGYGGGGGGQLSGPGGGGGYSGGATAGQWSSYSTYGGGGGSFNSGTNQDNESGVQYGNGLVIISYPLIPLCVPGCDDPLASNYDPTVNFNDGSCIYPGCIDPSACNFDPAANEDNGSCLYIVDCAGVCGGNSTYDDCGNCYDPDNIVTITFPYTGSLQSWCVPENVTSIHIEAAGGQGGGANGSTGGLGAYMSGDFPVSGGQQFKILVGGQGEFSPATASAGGGGGSFVTDYSNQPWIIAGGGGGTVGGPTNGNQDAPVTNNGLNAYSPNSPTNYGVGGSNGSGATNVAGGAACAGNGGGLFGDGEEPLCALIGGNTSGLAFANGGAPGTSACGGGVTGGYGGGGGGGCFGAGGGGGYSGGGGSYHIGGNGGGGGSFNAGDNQNNIPGFNEGNGYIIISFLDAPLCVPGCTDPMADNYNEEATFDDGSCTTAGCMDPLAANYNPNATSDNGSCIYPGCTYPTAVNYNPNANDDDGSCVFNNCPDPQGCTDVLACNYDANAIIDDGSCEYADAFYDCAGNCLSDSDNDGVCDELEIGGCMDIAACNYDPAATDDNGTCDYSCYGCTYVDADNYNPAATMDDGSCTFTLANCGPGTYWDPFFMACMPEADPCPQDINGDGTVNTADLLDLLSVFGTNCQ